MSSDFRKAPAQIASDGPDCLVCNGIGVMGCGEYGWRSEVGPGGSLAGGDRLHNGIGATSRAWPKLVSATSLWNRSVRSASSSRSETWKRFEPASASFQLWMAFATACDSPSKILWGRPHSLCRLFVTAGVWSG